MTSTPARGAGTLTFVLPDGSRTTAELPLTIGRSGEAGITIPDPTVSRIHVRISSGPDGPVIEDAGSRFGTLMSGELLTGPTRLAPAAVIRLGDVVVHVEDRPRDAWQADQGPQAGAGETLVVPLEATALGLRAPAAVDGVLRPRVRSGWALKRLAADEGDTRYVLQNLRDGSFVRMDASDASLFKLLDGSRTVPELLREATRLGGSGRLTRLIADLADRGLIAGIDPTPAAAPQRGLLARIFQPRERTVSWVSDYFERAYHRWGRVLFLPLSVTFLVLLALAGFGGFAYLVGARYGTPFVVANRLAIGGAVFIGGRFAIVALHELAHGLALAHYRRRASRGGIRLLLIFPYAFVDTSEAYFEPRPHRIVISAAGPASDLTLGACFSFACAVCPPGPIRDVFFQLAFGSYMGAFFNLNPFLDRDGYNILVDFLRQPRLRHRARVQLAQRLSGGGVDEESSSVLGRYALAGVIWSALGATFAVIFSNRYYERLGRLVPHGVILPVFIAFYVLLFTPVLLQLGAPIVRRLRLGTPEVNRVLY